MSRRSPRKRAIQFDAPEVDQKKSANIFCSDTNHIIEHESRYKRADVNPSIPLEMSKALFSLLATSASDEQCREAASLIYSIRSEAASFFFRDGNILMTCLERNLPKTFRRVFFFWCI